MTKEISREEALSSFLTDDVLNDFSLKGSDGETVRANRYVLASRSAVFKQMLVGGFSEATSKVVDIGYTGSILKAIVEYIHTDSAEMLRQIQKELEDSSDGASDVASQCDEKIQTLVSLAGAALYFDLAGFCKKIQECLSQYMEKSPMGAFAILEACRQEGPSAPAELADLALTCIRNGDAADVLSSPSDVACLSPSVLEEILQDTKTRMDDCQLFQIVRFWVEAETASDSNDYDRRTAAKDLMKHICLHRIDPKLLSTVVESSGLATQEQLMNAYKAQALDAEETHSISFKRPRYELPVWNITGTAVSTTHSTCGWQVLGVSPISSGVHRWTLKIEQDGPGLAFFGVRNQRENKSNSQHFCIGNGIVRRSTFRGITWQVGALKKGSKLTLTLNLLPEADGNGTLHFKYSAEGRSHVERIGGLRATLGGGSIGFVPIVFCSVGWQVCILNFEELNH